MQKVEQIWRTTKELIKELRALQKQEKRQEGLLKEKMQELMAIQELGKAIRRVLSVEELANKVATLVVKELRADSCTVMLIDKKHNELLIAAKKGKVAQSKKYYKLKIGEGLAGWCVRKKKPVHTLDMEKDKRFKRFKVNSYKKREYLCAPFISHNNVIGVINVERTRVSRPYKKEDVELLCTFADETVACFENAILFETLQNAYYDTIKALVIAMEKKDPFMQGHGERVARYSVKIGQAMGLNADEIKVIRYFSILHDIGKIGVPEKILTKPGKLSTYEWEYIKKHPEIGENIIEPIEFLQPVRSLLRHHHEWYNGMGYPDGLKGEDISIAARILAIADAFDAMQAERPYRKAYSKQKALEEIKKCSGTQFDPDIVDVFVKVFRKKSKQVSY